MVQDKQSNLNITNKNNNINNSNNNNNVEPKKVNSSEDLIKEIENIFSI